MSRTWFVWLAWFVWLGVALTGCGGSSQAVSRKISDLETQLTRVQNENDRLAERVGSLELQRATAQQSVVSEEASTVLERPPLKVIRMDPGQAQAATGAGAPRAPSGESEASGVAPEGSRPPGAETPDPKRPVLRIVGKKGGFRQGSGQPPPS